MSRISCVNASGWKPVPMEVPDEPLSPIEQLCDSMCKYEELHPIEQLRRFVKPPERNLEHEVSPQEMLLPSYTKAEREFVENLTKDLETLIADFFTVSGKSRRKKVIKIFKMLSTVKAYCYTGQNFAKDEYEKMFVQCGDTKEVYCRGEKHWTTAKILLTKLCCQLVKSGAFREHPAFQDISLVKKVKEHTNVSNKSLLFYACI